MLRKPANCRLSVLKSRPNSRVRVVFVQLRSGKSVILLSGSWLRSDAFKCSCCLPQCCVIERPLRNFQKCKKQKVNRALLEKDNRGITNRLFDTVQYCRNTRTLLLYKLTWPWIIPTSIGMKCLMSRAALHAEQFYFLVQNFLYL